VDDVTDVSLFSMECTSRHPADRPPLDRACDALPVPPPIDVEPPAHEPSEELRRRRESARRRTRRQRRLTAGLLVLLVAGVAVALLTTLGQSNAGNRDTRTRIAANQTHTGQPAGREPQGASGQTTGQASGTAAANGTASTGPGTGHSGTEDVPILMYHVIAPPPPGAPFPGLYVTPSEFTAQMEALKQAGWHAVTLDQVQAYWQRGVSLGPGRPIVISFDNGYQSQYTQALPVLRRLGWVGDENIQLTGLPPSQGGLSQRQVRGLLAAGWELDTQGFSHADLIALDAQELHYQVAVARNTVHQRYGVPVNWFCYPSGHYDATVIAAVKAAGYTGSTTVVPGWAGPGEDRYRLHRLRVLGGTSPSALLAQIADIRDDPPAPTSYNGA
jgi:peptidoglycan/xylan/chitin deacetylase (PgdA/CDA1 family)